MKLQLINLCYCILFLLSACSSSKPKFNSATVKNQIDILNKTYNERFINNDSNYYHDKYCIDAVVMPPNFAPIVGRDSIRKFFYTGEQGEALHMDVVSKDVYGTEDAIIEEGVYDFPDGKGGSIDKGKFIAIWKQENNKWKMYKEIWNSNLPIK